MGRMPGACFAALPLAFWSIADAVVAPAAAEGSGTTQIPLIVVSPTGIPISERNVGSSVSVVTAAEIERNQRRSIGDVLTMLPGINAVQTGGPGGQTAVFIRGTNSNHVKVFIDGIDVSDPAGANRTYDFAYLQTYDIERVELLRGPQSGLYGADAIGGVIVITTKKGEGPPKARAMVEGGSMKTFNQAAGLSGSTDRVNYSFHVSHLNSGDIPTTPDRFVVPGRPAMGNYMDNATGSTRLGFDVTPEFSANLVARYTKFLLRRSDLEFPAPAFVAVAPLRQTRQEHEQAFARGELVWKTFDGRLINKFGAAHSDLLTWNVPPDTAATWSRGRREKFDWRGEFKLALAHTLVLGFEKETEFFRANSLSRSAGNRGALAELQSEPVRRLFVVLNVRNDRSSQFGGYTTWRTALAYIVPGTETKLKASYGTGFKAPSLSQLYQDFPPFFTANPNLKPEKSKGYDAGFEQPLLSERIRFGVTYFRNDIEDLINCNTFCTTVINVDRAVITGAESFLTWTVTNRFKLRADYTYTKARNAVTRVMLQRRPKDKYTVQAVWQPTDRMTLTGAYLKIGSRVDVDRAFVDPMPISRAYSVVNIAADYTLNRQLTMFGRVDNLLNHRYEEPHGYLKPGLAAYVGLRATH